MKRSQLYVEVWSEPATRVAARYGCTSTWIKRLCNLHNIPTPTAPYWAMLKAGHPVQKTPLPDGDDVEIDLGTSLAVSGNATLNTPHAGDGEGSDSQVHPIPRQVKTTKASNKRERPQRVPLDPVLPSPRTVASAPPTVQGEANDVATNLKHDAALAQEYAEQWQRHQVMRSFLVEVAAHASALNADAEADLMAWVFRVEQRLDSVEPIQLLVNRLSARRV